MSNRIRTGENGDEVSNRTSRVDAFELLSGAYENRALQNVSLENRVPDIGYNPLYRQGQVLKPVVDRQYLKSGGRKPDWPNDADFAVCLTHDADQVSKYSLRQFIRESVRFARLEETTADRAKFLLKRTASFLGSWYDARKKPDPYHAYERWLEAEESIGARSTFFFMPETISEPHPTDPRYTFSDTVVFDGEKQTVAEMMREIDRRGWEIGLHPTWHTYDDPDELARQKAQIEQVLNHEVSSVRQHNLRYDIEKTPCTHTEVGLRFDSTLGFNNGVGFRFGTCYPWHLSDLEADERLPILEIPLIAQDTALLNSGKGLMLDEDTAFEYLIQLAEEVETVGGVLTLNWHPQYVAKPAWLNLYTDILEFLGTKDAWFASVEEIGDWWLNNGFSILQ